MKYIFKIIFFLFFSLKLFGTAQIPDWIIYQGDTLPLYSCPLESYPDSELIKAENLFNSDRCFFTACWRSYVATWEIINNELYLIKIQNACYPTVAKNVAASYNAGTEKDISSAFADLKILFPDRYKEGKVKADWVTGKMYSPKGELLYYIHQGFESIYENEILFTIKNGILLETKLLDNSKTRIKYTKNDTLAIKFIAKNINVKNLPKSDTVKRKVYVQIVSTDDNGNIDSVRVIKGVNKLYDNESMRVVKLIPEWDVIYRHGEKLNNYWIIPISFDLTNRHKQKKL